MFLWWTHGGGSGISPPSMTIQVLLPIVSSSCFNYHCRFLLLWRGSRSRPTQFKTLRRTRRGNKINPSSSHNHQMIPDHNFVVNLGIRVWFQHTKFFFTTRGSQRERKRLFPILISPFNQQKICFFSLWSHDHFHQVFFSLFYSHYFFRFFFREESFGLCRVFGRLEVDFGKETWKVGGDCNDQVFSSVKFV